MARADEQANFARWCRLVRLGSLVVFAGLGVLVAVAGLSMLKGYAGGVSGPTSRGLWAAVQFSPALGYAWALWAVQRTLADLGRGATFSPTVARAMRHIGYGVIVGALLSVFAVTNLSRVLMHGRGSFMYFDMSGIVLAVVGAALILLARLIDRARLIESELDEIL
jgi:hypothetical protein